MKKIIFIAAAIILGGSFFIASCNTQGSAQPKPGEGEISSDSMIKRGEYLVTIMGCDDCHSPKKMGAQGPEIDMDRRFAGHPSSEILPPASADELKTWVMFNMTNTASIGPWGISYSANLTSDDSGIGGWSEQQFIKAMREGKLKGMDNTRPILPPMPWQSFGRAKDEDLKAIFAFLKSTKPVNNIVPAAVAPDKIPVK